MKQQAEAKPNKCVFGESYDKYKRVGNQLYKNELKL